MNKLDKMTNEELAVSYVNGDSKAFDLLLNRTQSDLFTYILFVVHDEDMANDIFQETFVKAIVNLQCGKYTPSGKFSAWIMRIAHNVIMDWYRKHKAQGVVEVQSENDMSVFSSADMLDVSREVEIVNSQVMEDVKKIVDMLPANQREVVYMRYYQGLSFKEIAELTGVSINTSLGRMRYAILNMRKMAKVSHVSLDMEMV